MGLANYYCRFIPDFAILSIPLTDLLKGGKGAKPIHLRAMALTAFHDLKRALCEQTKLHTPLPDLPYILHMDASSTGLGAVLAQDTPQGERTIYYLTSKLTPTQHKYAVVKKEALAMRWAIDQLNYYLWGTRVHRSNRPCPSTMAHKNERHKSPPYELVSGLTAVPFHG